MTESNEMKMNEKPESPDKRRQQNATLAAGILTAMGLVLSIGDFLVAKATSWQDYFLLGAPIALTILGLISLVLLRRGRMLAGTSLVFIASLILPMVASLLQTKIGLAVFIYVLTSSVLLIWQVMPVSTRKWTIASTILVMAVIALINWMDPAIRINPADELVMFFYGASAVLVAAFLVQSARQLRIVGSIQTKIVLWAGIGFFLSAAFIIGYAAFTLRNQASRIAEETAREIARAQAAEIETILEKTLSAAETFTQSILVVKTEGVQLSREQVNAMLRQLIKDNPQFVGVDVLWEPNAFDGRDAEFANTEGSDANGRFLPYWTRGPGGEIQVELLQDYDISDWYQCPKTTKVSCLIDPYVYPVQGKDVWMTSVVVPFVVNDTFYGITGVDTPVTFLQEIADKAEIFDGKGTVVIMSNNGTLLGVTGRPELIGQPATALHNHFSAEDYLIVKNGEERLRYADDGMLEAFAPVRVGETVSPWSVNVIIPREIILADATRQMWNMIGIGGGLLVLSLVALFYAARQIAQPIRKLTETAQIVAGGNLDVAANVNSTDETGILANAFNQMTAQLRELIGSLEQRVAERTKDLATVAEISTTTAAIRDPFQMLATMVHLNQRRFNLYHSHVFTYHKETDDLRIVACGYREGDVHEGTHGTRAIPFSQEQSLVARAARTRKPVIVNDVRSDPGWLPNPLLPETRAEMAVPMIVGDELLGVLDVQADHVDAFTEEDANIQQTLASQIATSYQSALAYEQTKEQARFETLVNLINQKIQRATTVEDTLQTAIQELGVAIGASRVKASIGRNKETSQN